MQLIDLIPDLWQFITLIVLMHVSVVVAYLLQYNPRLSMLQIEAFQIYPWICDKCMTFWCNLVPCIILAYIWDYMFVLWGLITSIALVISVMKTKNLYK